MLQNSYLRKFCALMSQIVFLADLTVLRLITTVWEKISQNSCLREFCSLMSQIVFLTDLTVLRFYYQLYEQKCHKTHITTSFVHNCQKIVSLAEWPFYGLLELYEQKYHKTHISASSVNKYKKSCS